MEEYYKDYIIKDNKVMRGPNGPVESLRCAVCPRDKWKMTMETRDKKAHITGHLVTSMHIKNAKDHEGYELRLLFVTFRYLINRF